MKKPKYAFLVLMSILIELIESPTLWCGDFTLRNRQVKVVNENGAPISKAHVMRMFGNNENVWK